MTAAPHLTVPFDAPSNWIGAFDLARYSRCGALQIGVGDTSDPSNRALFGLRRSDQPDAWINIKAYDGVQAIDPMWDPDGLTASFPGLWPNADVSFSISRHRIDKRIVMASGAPTIYRFTLRKSPGLTHEWQPNGALLFRNDEGGPVFVLPPPWASDDNGAAVSVTMSEEDPVEIGGHSYSVIKLTVDADDFAGATFPVTVDPTTQITGTTGIEDNWLWASSPNANAGGYSLLFVRESGFLLRSVVRILASNIPAGIVTGFRLLAYVGSSVDTVNAYFVADTNDWVEGSALTVIQAGSSCWNYAKYNSQEWAGGQNGCGISGTDYDADVSPPQISPAPNQWNSFDLKIEWPSLWRDGVRAANGILLLGGTTSTVIDSTEGANPLYFEIDHEPASIGFGKTGRKSMRNDYVNLPFPSSVPDQGGPVTVAEYFDKTIQVTGTFVGLSMTIQGSMDGTNWSDITAAITAVGITTFDATVRMIRVNATALTSGTPVIQFGGRLSS